VCTAAANLKLADEQSNFCADIAPALTPGPDRIDSANELHHRVLRIACEAPAELAVLTTPSWKYISHRNST
jgi:hypothetical protein